MHFLAVTHDTDTKPGPGLFGDAILEQGHAVTVWNIDREGRAPQDLSYDGIIVYGGEQNVGEYDRFPYLQAEEEMIKAALAAATPYLGICLGGQMLAHVLGGRVAKLLEPELGWRQVSLTQDALRDPLFDALPPTFLAAEWHYYDFLLPPGATLLAANETCAQAYRYQNAWGVQFHPEVTGRVLSRWASLGWPGFKEGEPAFADQPSEREALSAWNAIGRQLAQSFVAFCART